MPIITISAGTPAIPAGTYLAQLIAVTPKRMVTQFSKNGEEQDFYEWLWLVHAEDRTVEINSLTSTSTSPLSRIHEYLVAMLGADKIKTGFRLNTDDLIGKQVMVQTVETENGFAKIDKIVAAPKSMTRATTPAPTPAPAPAPVGDGMEDLELPF